MEIPSRSFFIRSKAPTGRAFKGKIEGSKDLYRIEHPDESVLMENA